MNSFLKQFNDVVELFGDENYIQLEEEIYLKHQDMLQLMKDRGYLLNVNADNMFIFYKNANFDEFGSWLKEQIKESNRMKRRDWIIAIVSGCIGAVIGLIPWVVSLFS